MHKIGCSEIWGGIQNTDVDACTRSLTVSLYSSSACGGDVGGDIYYFSVCGGDKLTRIVLGDVAGHGSDVSHISEWIYNSMISKMNRLEGHLILNELNNLINERGLEAMSTMAVVSYYLPKRKLYFSYAGHPPFYLRNHEKSWYPALLNGSHSSINIPLGIFSGINYDQEEKPLGSGDRIFLYTDGVVEAPNKHGEFFGRQQLQSILNEFGHRSTTTIKNNVLNALNAHTDGSLKHDDITMMVIEIH